MQYHSVRPDLAPLRARIRKIATAQVSYGYRRVRVLPRSDGWTVNAKRTYRLYGEECACPDSVGSSPKVPKSPQSTSDSTRSDEKVFEKSRRERTVQRQK